MKLRMRELRLEKGLSIRELSRISGIPNSTLANYENGSRDIDIYQAEKVAKAMGVYLDDLLESDYYSPARRNAAGEENAFDAKSIGLK